AGVVARCLGAVARSVRGSRTMATSPQWSATLATLPSVEEPPADHRLVARVDGCLDDEGRYRLVGCDATLPSGLLESDVIRSAFLGSALLTRDLTAALVSHSCA